MKNAPIAVVHFSLKDNSLNISTGIIGGVAQMVERWLSM